MFSALVLDRFFAILIALVLSHIMGIRPVLTPKSSNCCLIHNNCAQQDAAATYFASAVERATKFCFLVAYETRHGPRKFSIPDVLFRSTKYLA